MTGLLWVLRYIPPRVYWVLGVFTCLCVGVWWHQRATDHAYAAGWEAAALAAQAVQPVYRDRVIRAVARTDTVLQTVYRRVHAVDTLIQQVPETLRVMLPPVDRALAACTALARDCDQLRADVQTERVARDSLEQSQAVVIVAQTATIQHLSRRPTRVRAVAGAVLMAAVGFVIGSR